MRCEKFYILFENHAKINIIINIKIISFKIDKRKPINVEYNFLPQFNDSHNRLLMTHSHIIKHKALLNIHKVSRTLDKSDA